jgi:hypothetical protein
VTEPPPLLYCGEFDGAWKPPESLDELPPEPLDELPPEEPSELDDPEELDPLEEELDPLEVEALPFAAAWLVPGRITATAPAASTLATDTVTVVAFSRRRPSSRSATASATRRAACAVWAAGRPRSACFSQLFTTSSVTCSSVSPVGELSQDVLSAQGSLPARAELPVFSNAQRRLHCCLRRRVRR